jgi:hypothetical protein
MCVMEPYDMYAGLVRMLYVRGVCTICFSTIGSSCMGIDLGNLLSPSTMLAL